MAVTSGSPKVNTGQESVVYCSTIPRLTLLLFSPALEPSNNLSMAHFKNFAKLVEDRKDELGDLESEEYLRVGNHVGDFLPLGLKWTWKRKICYRSESLSTKISEVNRILVSRIRDRLLDSFGRYSCTFSILCFLAECPYSSVFQNPPSTAFQCLCSIPRHSKITYL